MVVLWWHGTMQPLLKSESEYCLLGNVSLSDNAEMSPIHPFYASAGKYGLIVNISQLT
jgi:hypothetical protein